MERQAIMGTYVLHEHMFPCQVSEDDPGMLHDLSEKRRANVLAAALAALLIGGATLAAWGAVALDGDLDRGHSGIATAGAFAGAFCLFALFKIAQAARGTRGWGQAGISLGLAVLALLALDAVAFGSRLGG
jgi:hypothetical protein